MVNIVIILMIGLLTLPTKAKPQVNLEFASGSICQIQDVETRFVEIDEQIEIRILYKTVKVLVDNVFNSETCNITMSIVDNESEKDNWAINEFYLSGMGDLQASESGGGVITSIRFSGNEGFTNQFDLFPIFTGKFRLGSKLDLPMTSDCSSSKSVLNIESTVYAKEKTSEIVLDELRLRLNRLIDCPKE